MAEKEPVSELVSDATAADVEKQENADFGAGFDGKSADKPIPASPEGRSVRATEKPEPAATPRAKEEPKPEYVNVTAKEWAEVRAAAAKTASYDQQLSKAFGTIGNLAKQIAEQKAAGQPAAAAATARKIEIPKEAFAAMERDFPELAQQTRSALEAALAGVSKDVDVGAIESMLAAHTNKRELAALAEEWPNWVEIVGAVRDGEQPNPEQPFRKWLATKDPAYQTRINDAKSAAVLDRAIRLFYRETAAPTKVNGTPRDTARADRIRSAVQPRGDNAGAAPGKSDDDEFLSGFNSR